MKYIKLYVRVIWYYHGNTILLMVMYIFRGIPRRDNDHGKLIARQMCGFGE